MIFFSSVGSFIVLLPSPALVCILHGNIGPERSDFCVESFEAKRFAVNHSYHLTVVVVESGGPLRPCKKNE